MGERRGTKALEQWCRRMTEGYPGVKIDNMTTSWRDGLAFCAIIHHFRPDLIEFDKLNKTDIYYNNELAFNTAEKYLGIPALLDADDMAAYEVPDRLSILTYLSQFYQVFAHTQESANRLKRSQPAGEKTPISKSTGPPSKMAHVVGVPRRDPCQKCQLPVFLAERLVVGKNVFHRTCLKCARCGSQLTPGSFYETEVNNEYCCETCPDEEERLDTKVGSRAVEEKNSDYSTATPMAKIGGVKAIRNSLSDRLAFFEQNAQVSGQSNINNTSYKVLGKSVSDEEKCHRIGGRLEEQQSSGAVMPPHPSYKVNEALSTFLQDTIDSELKSPEDEGVVQDAVSHTDTMNTSDIEDDESDSLSVDAPPTLPTSEPPTSITDVAPFRDENMPHISKEADLAVQNSQTTAFVYNSDSTATVAATSVTLPSARPRFTTKTDVVLITTQENIHSPTDENHDASALIEPKKPYDETPLTTDRQAVEEINSVTPPSHSIINNAQSQAEVLDASPDITERLHVVSAQLRVIENESKIKDSNNVEHKVDEELEKPEVVKPLGTKELTDTLLKDTEVLLKEQEVENGGIEIKLDQKVDGPMEELKQEVPLTEESEGNELIKNNNFEESKLDGIMNSSNHVPDTTDLISERTFESPLPETAAIPAAVGAEYPQSLNPFSSDEDEDNNDVEPNEQQHKLLKSIPLPSSITTTSSTPKSNQNSKNTSLNPFDSSDDEVELEKNQTFPNILTSTSKVPPPRPPPPRIVRNPFGECDESLDMPLRDLGNSQFERRSSLTSSLNKRGPLPTPRTSLTQSQSPTPEPTPRMSQRNGTQHSRRQLYDSSSSLNTSITTPASMQRDTDIRGSNNSLASSAGGTVRSRKSRRAPAPPSHALKELFPSTDNHNSNSSSNNTSKATTPNSSRIGSPKSIRKKRPAPAPPKPARLDASLLPQIILQDQENQAQNNNAQITLQNQENQAQNNNAQITLQDQENQAQNNNEQNMTDSKNVNSYPLQSELNSKLSDEEKALLEGKRCVDLAQTECGTVRRMIPLDDRLLSDDEGDMLNSEDIVARPGEQNTAACGYGSGRSDDLKQHKRQQRTLDATATEEEETNIVYRRILMPPNMDTPTHDGNPLLDQLRVGETAQYVPNRQLEKLKDNKEAQNRNRQSQVSISPTIFDVADNTADPTSPYYNKSQHGKWKRRKGPAPALPIPPRKVLQMLPLQEIRHELEIIEVQQQGLEKQGVILEKMIRDRCEGQINPTSDMSPSESVSVSENIEVGKKQQQQQSIKNGEEHVQNSKEVEDLILQLFELVNEKNELFRRQAELMYLRRQHRLEQEQADIEYEIRVLMGQPERNKTDSDKSREEKLIARLIEVVELRNEVIDCLEMDRLREAEEDLSIKQRLELHNAKRDTSFSHEKEKSATAKLSKKEKKQQKEAKKMSKSKKLDVDKDADETELKLGGATGKDKAKKKKKLFF